MATRITNNIITGNDPHLGMNHYYSPHFGKNIWRKASSLTGARTKREPAFNGFRQSSGRLKQASPIAASLYKLVPAEVKQYALYRTLTGEAIKMLKEGGEADIISETLKRKYINSLLNAATLNSDNKTVKEPATNDSVKGMSDFTSLPPKASGERKMTRTRRAQLLQKIISGQSIEEFYNNDSEPLPQITGCNSASTLNQPEQSKTRTKTTSGLQYLGRCPDCKKLKIWIQSPFLS